MSGTSTFEVAPEVVCEFNQCDQTIALHLVPFWREGEDGWPYVFLD